MDNQADNREPTPGALRAADFDELRLKLSDAVGLENPLEQRLAVTAVITDALAPGSTGDRFWAESMLAVHYPEIDWPYLHKEAARRGFLPAVEAAQKAAKKHLPS
ncbi:MAG: hypothetical protein M1379_06950 [Firmicutes bacterium]|nr:hypothetical protein [Bacillota bacterium]